LCIDAALKGGKTWWVGPTYSIASIGWHMIRALAIQIPNVDIRDAERSITFPMTKGQVQVRSADDPDSLRGDGLDLVVLDECAWIAERAWTEALRPALADRQGRAVFISTPRGRNWFFRLHEVAKQTVGWASWQSPTSSNPHIEPAEIDAARDALPDRVFRQEFLAEFVDDAGAVFRRVSEAATSKPQRERIAGHSYSIGVDWGKSADFSVFTVIDGTTREMVAMERMNQVDYTLQAGRLRALVAQFKPSSVIVERNAMGEPLIEQLQRDGMDLDPFTTTNSSKAGIIDALALAFEREELQILDDETLLGELRTFEMMRLPSGMLRYGAPKGLHDDCVMSLALALHGTLQGEKSGIAWI
jgi:phage terminase large subunit-like protein|tara:strand:+ start:289 stop:1365 length:1077 start_codon:yes stop_codon:yes gene_type:complete